MFAPWCFDFFFFLQNIKTLPKNSVFYVPGFGQLLWATECVFLSRSYAKDEKNILKQCTLYKESSMPIQVRRDAATLFVVAKVQEYLFFQIVPKIQNGAYCNFVDFMLLIHHKIDQKMMYNVCNYWSP